MKILGIETSCDETAAAVVEDGRVLLSNVVRSSMDLHAAFGGVVPEIAARSHIEAIMPVIDQALRDAACDWDDIDAIAVTYGAGLGGCLLVGVLTARTLAIAKDKPLYAINHVEGHIYVNFLTETTLEGYKLPEKQPEFPMLGLIVSGGHSQLVLWRDHFDYTLLGQTNDDAIGEAFDKVAKILGLPYPGGPSVSKLALEGDPLAYKFPKAKLDAKYDYSYSGVKTAVLRTAQKLIGETHEFPSYELQNRLSDQQKADIAASFQRIAVETVVDKTIFAVEEFQPKSVVIGGGVAASPELRRQLAERLPFPLRPSAEVSSSTQSDDFRAKAGNGEGDVPDAHRTEPGTALAEKGWLSGDDTSAEGLHYTDPKLCTDNGAMIAALGCWHMKKGQPVADPYSLDISPNLSM